MKSKGKENLREENFRLLIENYVRAGVPSAEFEDSEHLDGDTISAFIEGGLNEKESSPITSHLVSCSFCRHKSAELLRLDAEFAEAPAPVPSSESSPTRVSDVIGGIIGKLFGSQEGAVFAHQEDEDPESEDEGEDEEGT